MRKLRPKSANELLAQYSRLERFRYSSPHCKHILMQWVRCKEVRGIKPLDRDRDTRVGVEDGRLYIKTKQL